MFIPWGPTTHGWQEVPWSVFTLTLLQHFFIKSSYRFMNNLFGSYAFRKASRRSRARAGSHRQLRSRVVSPRMAKMLISAVNVGLVTYATLQYRHKQIGSEKDQHHYLPDARYQNNMRSNLSPFIVSSKTLLFFCFAKNENRSSAAGRNLKGTGNKAEEQISFPALARVIFFMHGFFFSPGKVKRLTKI